MRNAHAWRMALIAVAASLLNVATLTAQMPGEPREQTGRELYDAACAACHGTDGRGAPQHLVGFDTPLPDFSDCSFSTVEPDADWMAVAHDGGPARGFDRRMPAFGEALSTAELQRTLDHLRGFCPSRAWPRGELNMPRALVTEKAYPENETVWTTTVNATDGTRVVNELLYEQRLGARSQFELLLPFIVQERSEGSAQRGLGDVAVAFKHALLHSFERGRIFSVAAEIVLPVGDRATGLGKGTTIFEPFVAFGQLLPADGFVQLQAGLELPFDTERAGREAFWRAAVGRSFTQGRFGRSWSPMVELLAARELETNRQVQWDLVPQVQITLNQRQHLMINAGVRFPVNARQGRSTQVIAYFLWDWFDGGLRDGW